MLSLKPLCLNCSFPLSRKFVNNRFIHVCNSCQSHSALLPDLKKIIKEHEYEKVVSEIKRLSVMSSRHCPFCHKQMKLALKVADECDLDICSKCQIVWYDRYEKESLAGTLNDHSEVKMKLPSAVQGVAEYRVDDNHSYVSKLGLMGGLPAEDAEEVPQETPWVSITICFLMFVCSAWFFNHKTDYINMLETASSVKDAVKIFFMLLLVQSGWISLIFTIFLFYSFADNVEDRLGKFKFIMLVLLTHFINCALVMKFYKQTGGVSQLGMRPVLMAVMTCYSLIFPNYKIYISRFFQNYRINMQLMIFGLVIVDALFTSMLSKAYGVAAVSSSVVGVACGALFYFLFYTADNKKKAHN